MWDQLIALGIGVIIGVWLGAILWLGQPEGVSDGYGDKNKEKWPKDKA